MFVASVVSMEYFYNNLSCIKTMKALAYPRLVCIVWSMAHFYVFLLVPQVYRTILLLFFQSPLTRSMGRGVTSHFKRSLNHCRYWFLRKHRGMEGGPGAWFQLKRSHKSSLTAVSPTKSASAIIATFSASAPSHLEKFQLSPPAWRMLFH